MIKSQKVLLLQIESGNRNDFLITSSVKVRFHISSLDLDPNLSNREVLKWEYKKSALNYKKIIKYFNSFQEIRIAGESIFKFFEFQGISMWQFIPPYLQAVTLRSIEIIDVVEPIICEENPNHIYVISSHDVTNNIWEQTIYTLGKKYAIPVISVNDNKENVKITRFIDYKGRQKKFFFDDPKTFDRLNTYTSDLEELSPHLKTQKLGKKVLLATNHRHWIQPAKKENAYDEQFSPLIEFLIKKNWNRIIGLDCSLEINKVLISFRKRNKRPEDKILWKSFFNYWSEKLNNNYSSWSNRKFEELKNSEDFIANFQYKDLSLFPILYKDIEHCIKYYIPYCIQSLEVAKTIIEDEKPDAVIVSSEAVGLFERAIVITAGLRNIPSIGLQHGMIFDNHYHYLHQNISTDPLKYPFGFIRPTLTCVWGKGWKHILTNKGYYPKSSIKVTGNWRYDHIINLRNTNINVLKTEYNIPDNHSVICIASGNQNIVNFVFLCLQHLQGLTNCTFLIKLHPLDDPAAMKKELSQRIDIKHLIFPQVLTDVLLMSDIIITQPSTIISEAILLHKNVILINYEYNSGWEVYNNSNICSIAVSMFDLKNKVENILKNPLIDTDVLKARRLFLNSYFYKQDGNASKRVVKVLDELLQTNRTKNYTK